MPSSGRQNRTSPAIQAPPPRSVPPGYHLRRIPLDRIDVPQLRIRRELGAIGELAYSLGSVGILQPIQVLKVGSRYRLVAGERRLEAARMLGWSEIEALVREPRGNDLLLELVENAQRKFLTDAEEADAFIRLVRDDGFQSMEVAAQAGRSEAYVSKRVRVFEDATLRSAIERQQLSVSMAEEFLTVPIGSRPALVSEALEGHWDVHHLRSVVRALGDGASRLAARENGANRAADIARARRSAARALADGQLRGRDLVRHLNTARDAIGVLRPYELTPAEERALSSLFQALLLLARARQRASKGPIYPSFEAAEALARRH